MINFILGTMGIFTQAVVGGIFFLIILIVIGLSCAFIDFSTKQWKDRKN